jgi:murein DD-endopeptidase MepM/ murein hydrolase activator NlpD
MLRQITVILSLAGLMTGLFGNAMADERVTGKEGKGTVKDTIPLKFRTLSLPLTPQIESFDDLDNLDPDALMSEAGYDPNFDYFGIWDTISVNPYKIDLTEKPDTTEISLCESGACDYHHPFPGEVTSNFGPRGRNRLHLGIDINLETGDTVRCAFEGIVRIARRSSTFGNVVVVRHKNGLETVYAHLSKIGVEIGQHVDAGELLGLGGNTGRSFGSHLHFEVRYKGMAIDPNLVINFGHCELKTDKILIDKHTFSYVKDYKQKKGKSRVYTVRKGDTLGKIAKRHGTSVKALCRMNGLKSTSVLRPGRRLRVG